MEETINHIERRDKELPYISDENVMAEQAETRKKLQKFNTMDTSDFQGLSSMIRQILGKTGGNIFVNPPFYCDYGTHIEVGENFCANYNCTILDVAKVIIGKNVLLAPNVAIYTAGHPIDPVARNSAYEYGIGITIGDNCWIGGNTVITPGVHIGNNVVIGAGSVVTKDIPDNVVAAGNPCRVIRPITEEDRYYYYKKRKFPSDTFEEIEKYRAKEEG